MARIRHRDLAGVLSLAADVLQAFLTEGRAPWGKMQSIFALVRYFGGTEQLAWVFQWIMNGAVAVLLVLMWRSSRIGYPLKAAALAAGCLLVTPYLFLYDMMVLAIALAFLVRIGLSEGFQPYELPALGLVAALSDVLSAGGRADRFRGNAGRLVLDREALRFPAQRCGVIGNADPRPRNALTTGYSSHAQ